VTFSGSVNSSGATRTLTVNTTGITTFGGAVGDVLALGTLSTNAGGRTVLGGNVTTANAAASFGDAVELTADAVITTGSAAVVFAGTVDGGHALTVNTTGAITFGGAVGSTTALSSLGVSAGGTTAINGGGITTTGAQSFGNAVTLGGLPAVTLTAGGDVSFSSTVNGARALTINTPGNTVFGAAVGNTAALTGLVTDAGGVTSLAGNVSATNAPITFGDNVLLTGNSAVSAGNGAVTFGGTVDSSGAGRALTINSTGVSTFGGAVGSGMALASVATNAGGSTVIGGGAVTTTGNQGWGDAVTLTADTVFTGATPTFASTVNGGGFNLRLDYSGLTALNGANFTGIRDLETGNGGSTQIAGTVTTTGTQTYNDGVLLTAATTLNATGVAFAGTVNSSGAARALTVNSAGTTSFGGAVGNTLTLAAITTDAGGNTVIGGNITATNAAVNFGDAVTLAAGSTINAGSGAVTFGGSVDGAHALTVNSSGITTFNGAVGGATALVSLTTNAGGSTRIGAGVSTTGNQVYGDAVVLTGNSVLSGATPAFASTVNGGGFDLGLDFGGTTVINGAAFSNLGSLSTGNGGMTQLSGTIVTAGSQTYHDAVTTTGAVTLNAGGAITASAAVTATAGLLNLVSGSDIDLSAAGSNFGAVQATATGNVALTDINSLIVNSVSAGGSLRIAASGDLQLNGAVSAAAAGDAAVLAAGGNFINGAGAAAISTPSGRWLVYSADPDTAVFGGLASGNAALWSQTFAGNPPATIAVGGNRYLFAAGRVLTVSAGDAAKVYGDDLTGLLTAFSVTGFNANTYGGAVTADLQTDAVSGLPALTSAGAAATAGVAGSPYDISAAAGTLASPHGYNFVFSPVLGQLAVSPAALTVLANDVSRNYGVANPPFSVSYVGLRAGDTPLALGGAAEFVSDAAEKSLPGRYTISVSGLISPNYVITYVPGSLTVINRGVDIESQGNVLGVLAAPGDVVLPSPSQGSSLPPVTCGGSGPVAGLRCASANRN
jgi:hypothetical protein